MLTASKPLRRAILVRGVVQGVGFRPFVYRVARARGLSGWVRNEAGAVRIEVQAAATQLDAFVEELLKGHPPQARIDACEVIDVPYVDGLEAGFHIHTSSQSHPPLPAIPADLATCDECLREICTPDERRYGYPFTNCTNCGPRWSIIEHLPYDRPHTSMARFPMCAECRAEYEQPADRRFHAQPIACPRCGPKLKLLGPDGSLLAAEQDPLAAASAAIIAGEVIALKGLGGFQLLVDATDRQAVARLRQRKQRPHRPLAVMMQSLEEVRLRCEVSAQQAAALRSYQAPIVLLRRRTDPQATADVVEEVAPGNPYLGTMLPYTPLHHLLLQRVARPLVCTSGNLSEEPMAITTSDALRRLGRIADAMLTHDRPILRPVDDSVVHLGPQGQQVLRRARGYAPLPIKLSRPSPVILALGAHLKNTVALALPTKGTDTHRAPSRSTETAPLPLPLPASARHSRLAASTSPPAETVVVLSSHVGDLDHVLSLEVHRRAASDLVRFYDVQPQLLACDLHPDYGSTTHAEQLAAKWHVPLVRVQHHQAHVAACMAEHDLRPPVLGLAWDGAGYGLDSTIWGGEALLCTSEGFTRLAHLRTFPLPGGDQAARQPRRSALGLLFEIFGPEATRYTAAWFSAAELNGLLAALEQSLCCPRTSSMGRLFDAVAALCGLWPTISFEGQAAMAWQFAAEPHCSEAYPLPLSPQLPAVVDWEPLVRAVLEDRTAGVPIGRISARFHNALAEMAAAVALRSGCPRVVLSGGCFQNALLAERVQRQLSQAGFTVYSHQRVPPGDGGIALGQVYLAAMASRP